MRWTVFFAVWGPVESRPAFELPLCIWYDTNNTAVTGSDQRAHIPALDTRKRPEIRSCAANIDLEMSSQHYE